MFNTEQRGLVVGFRRLSLTPVLIALLTAYAGLSTAVAGFVLDSTAMVVVGLVLVGSGRVLVNLITWAMMSTRRVSSASHCINR
jgi:NAD/NADP transhydrogenase beta subunit